jgi:sulfur-oxidizing protein SoxZ
MRIRAQSGDGLVRVVVLIDHEMETGHRRNSEGVLVPAWYVEQVDASINGRVVWRVRLGPSISKNPLLRFEIWGGQPGDSLEVSWVDNKGDKRRDVTTVA